MNLKGFRRTRRAGVLSVFFILTKEKHTAPAHHGLPVPPYVSALPATASGTHNCVVSVTTPTTYPLTHNNKTEEMAYMTQEGYDKMVAQLRHMESVERPAASAAIAEARDKGDLSENSEYDAAKEAQAMLEMKINNLKATIAEAKIIDASKLRADVVQILSTVEMKNAANGMKMKYTIVSESEANLREGKISSTTPIAQGLLGHKVGDVVDVKIPQGVIKLEILNISVD